jgi:hypothetical protein
MTIRIIVLATNEKTDALIREGSPATLPSIQEGWRFDFRKQLKNLKDAIGYILVREDTPETIEGCMIFQLIDKKKPFMAFIEVAPHNKGVEKKHDHVAGCLIAYAFKLSLMKGVGEYRGALHFEIGEENKEDEIKLMTLYSNKYNAYRLSDSNIMGIYDDDGEKLIERYLT